MRDDLTEIKKRLEEFKRNVPRIVAANAVNFFKDRFVNENWLDKQPEKWKERKHKTGRKTDSRATLTKTGRLRRSIRATSATFDKIAVASLGVPYAEAHNEGYSGEVSQVVKAHTRKAHTRKGYTSRKGNEIPPKEIKETQVDTHTRKIKQNIPKRRFIGNSHALNEQTTEILKREFEKVFK